MTSAFTATDYKPHLTTNPTIEPMNFTHIPDDAPDELRNWNYNRFPYECSDGYCGAEDCKACHPLTWDDLECDEDE